MPQRRQSCQAGPKPPAAQSTQQGHASCLACVWLPKTPAWAWGWCWYCSWQLICCAPQPGFSPRLGAGSGDMAGQAASEVCSILAVSHAGSTEPQKRRASGRWHGSPSMRSTLQSRPVMLDIQLPSQESQLGGILGTVLARPPQSKHNRPQKAVFGRRGKERWLVCADTEPWVLGRGNQRPFLAIPGE